MSINCSTTEEDVVLQGRCVTSMFVVIVFCVAPSFGVVEVVSRPTRFGTVGELDLFRALESEK